ncbi:MAG: rRNA (uracil1498-N3)-methyltransferase [Verrucomicrobiota bacterium]
MHRFYLVPEQCKEPTVFLTGREAHHALRVLRVRRGERVTVLDGSGLELLCEVQEFDRDKVKLAVIERHLQPGPLAQITLLQAVPKGKMIESIIQKATELGVSRIVPLLSDRVVSQMGGKDSAQKAGKWQSVAVEAIKQCGSAWLPKVEAPLTPAQFLKRKEKFDLPLVASLQPGSRHPREVFQSFHAKEGRPPKSICAWVGPEGDFTPAEVGEIEAGGALPITLGRLVLRVETAAVYCLSVINYEIN